MDSQPSPTLLWEYDRLTPYKLEILRLCQHPTFWKQGGLNHSITVLYQLIETGLLTGPRRGKPYEVPFALTNQGRTILARIERGLHRPEWITPTRVKALGQLAGGDWRYLEELKGVGLLTLQSLQKNGYVLSDLHDLWAITPLGLEAWQERQEALAEWEEKEVHE